MNNYKIELVNKTGEEADGYASSFPDKTASAESTAKPSKGAEDSGKWKTPAALKTFAKVYAGTALARSVFRYEMSRVGVRTGNSDLQDKINYGLELAGQIGGVAGAFAIGGPAAGALALAAVGISYAQKYDQYNYNREWEGISLQQSRLRAGPSWNRSR